MAGFSALDAPLCPLHRFWTRRPIVLQRLFHYLGTENRINLQRIDWKQVTTQ
ncbi:hypothetical protein SynA1825c_00912 [Synechococcus sp. A18-25c]|nr:hypothetical protein SynA1825c_00912 [Synechococcus sp. A18-25c]